MIGRLPYWLECLRKLAPGGKLVCADCGRPIHKRDRYVILAVLHRDCLDPKQVGQQSLKEQQQ